MRSWRRVVRWQSYADTPDEDTDADADADTDTDAGADADTDADTEATIAAPSDCARRSM